MRYLVPILLTGLFVLLGAALVLLLAWPISAFAAWCWGLDTFHALIVAKGVLLVIAVLVHAVAVQNASEAPWNFLSEAFEASNAKQIELDELPGEGEGHWFAPCPCESGKPFAKCCGKRAFKSKGA